MIHYITGGMTVNLPADFSAEIIYRNPLLTKEGDYTLDIDIDLGDPHNARVYEHLHRIDRHHFTTTREAMLYDEHGIIIMGRELVLEASDKKVKVQVVGGLSELNNELNSGKTIRQLSLPSPIPADYDGPDFWPDGQEYRNVATRIIRSGFTDYTGVMAPAMIDTDRLVGLTSFVVPTYLNDERYDVTVSHDFGGTYPYPSAAGEAFCVFPWLWLTVEAVLYGLGFTVERNLLKEDARFQRLLVIGGAYGWKTVLDFLPDWDVSTFLTEVEKLCNVVLVPHMERRVVDIVSIEEFYENGNTTTVIARDDIIGEIAKKTDAQESGGSDVLTLYDKVSYDLPSTSQYKYLCVDEEVMAASRVVECDDLTPDSTERSYVYNVWRQIKGSWDFAEDHLSTEAEKEYLYGNHLFHDPALDMQFVLKLQEEDTIPVYSYEGYNKDGGVKKEKVYDIKISAAYYLQHINTLRPVTRREGGNEVTLKIVPCEMGWVSAYSRSPASGGIFSLWPMPCLRDGSKLYEAKKLYIYGEEEKTGDNTINDEIQNGVETASVPSNIFVAFYFGTFDPMGDDQLYPIISPTNRLVRYRSDSPDCKNAEVVSIDMRSQEELTLELDGKNGLYATCYAKNELFDSDKEYTIRFKTQTRPDPRSVFVIDHVRFYCKQLKFHISEGRMSEVAEGVFYPVAEKE